MKNEIQDYVNRPKKYENIDGTVEMLFGLMFLGFALCALVRPDLGKYSAWATPFVGLLVIYAVLGPGYWAKKAIKKHITYPRTGYVAHRRDAKSRAHEILLAMLVGAVLAAGVVLLMSFGQRHNTVNLTRLGIQSIVVAAYAYIFLRTSGEHQWKWFVVVWLALGSLAMSFAGWDLRRFNQVSFLFSGFTWLISGGITLYLYIRRTQPPAVETD
jgi:hypothetical protein